MIPLKYMLEQPNAVTIRIIQVAEISDIMKLPMIRHLNPQGGQPLPRDIDIRKGDSNLPVCVGFQRLIVRGETRSSAIVLQFQARTGFERVHADRGLRTRICQLRDQPHTQPLDVELQAPLRVRDIQTDFTQRGHGNSFPFTVTRILD